MIIMYLDKYKEMFGKCYENVISNISYVLNIVLFASMVFVYWSTLMLSRFLLNLVNSIILDFLTYFSIGWVLTSIFGVFGENFCSCMTKYLPNSTCMSHKGREIEEGQRQDIGIYRI